MDQTAPPHPKSIDELDPTSDIGEGSEGRVKKAYKLDDVNKKYPYAVKTIKAPNPVGMPPIEYFIMAQHMLNNNHPNVVDVYGAHINPGNQNTYYHFILEFFPDGSVLSVLEKDGRFDEQHTRKFAQQCVSGASFFWKKGIVHNDLKPGNILMHKKGFQIKVTDPGLAYFLRPEELTTTTGGTLLYSGAETKPRKDGKPLEAYDGYRQDVHSIAASVLHAFLGKFPRIAGDNPLERYASEVMSVQLYDFLKRGLEADWHKRLSPQMMMDHEYIKGAPLNNFKMIGEHLKSGVRLVINQSIVIKEEPCNTFPTKFVLQRDVVVGENPTPGPPYVSLCDEHGELLPGATYIEESQVNVLVKHVEVIVEERRERRLRISKYYIPKFIDVPSSFPDAIVQCHGWITEKTTQGHILASWVEQYNAHKSPQTQSEDMKCNQGPDGAIGKALLSQATRKAGDKLEDDAGDKQPPPQPAMPTLDSGVDMRDRSEYVFYDAVRGSRSRDGAPTRLAQQSEVVVAADGGEITSMMEDEDDDSLPSKDHVEQQETQAAVSRLKPREQTVDDLSRSMDSFSLGERRGSLPLQYGISERDVQQGVTGKLGDEIAQSTAMVDDESAMPQSLRKKRLQATSPTADLHTRKEGGAVDETALRKQAKRARANDEGARTLCAPSAKSDPPAAPEQKSKTVSSGAGATKTRPPVSFGFKPPRAKPGLALSNLSTPGARGSAQQDSGNPLRKALLSPALSTSRVTGAPKVFFALSKKPTPRSPKHFTFKPSGDFRAPDTMSSSRYFAQPTSEHSVPKAAENAGAPTTMDSRFIAQHTPEHSAFRPPTDDFRAPKTKNPSRYFPQHTSEHSAFKGAGDAGATSMMDPRSIGQLTTNNLLKANGAANAQLPEGPSRCFVTDTVDAPSSRRRSRFSAPHGAKPEGDKERKILSVLAPGSRDRSAFRATWGHEDGQLYPKLMLWIQRPYEEMMEALRALLMPIEPFCRHFNCTKGHHIGLTRLVTGRVEVCEEFLRGKCASAATCGKLHCINPLRRLFGGRLAVCYNFRAWFDNPRNRMGDRAILISNKLPKAVRNPRNRIGDRAVLIPNKVCPSYDHLTLACDTTRSGDACNRLHDQNELSKFGAKVAAGASRDGEYRGSGSFVCIKFLNGVCDSSVKNPCPFVHNVNLRGGLVPFWLLVNRAVSQQALAEGAHHK